MKLKLGDLVIWNGGMDTWYKGEIGLVIDFCTMKNPWILYPNGELVRLTYQSLEIIS